MKNLDEIQRKEIVDYVLALGLDSAQQGLYQDLLDNRHPIVRGPELTDAGWRGRLAKGVYTILTEFDAQQLVDLGFSRGAADQISKERETIRTEWAKKMLWSSFQDRWRINDRAWNNIVEKALRLVALPARIDTVVTTDIHRLIRMPETLNGKTGLRAALVDLDTLEEFDPFDRPVAFEGTQKVFVRDSPEIRIRDRRLGPFINEKVELPLAAAVLLVAKGVANPVE